MKTRFFYMISALLLVVFSGIFANNQTAHVNLHGFANDNYPVLIYYQADDCHNKIDGYENVCIRQVTHPIAGEVNSNYSFQAGSSSHKVSIKYDYVTTTDIVTYEEQNVIPMYEIKTTFYLTISSSVSKNVMSLTSHYMKYIKKNNLPLILE